MALFNAEKYSRLRYAALVRDKLSSFRLRRARAVPPKTKRERPGAKKKPNAYDDTGR